MIKPHSLSANELGLYYMSGNVWEWGWDWYAAYLDGALTSDTDAGLGAALGKPRVSRDGSFDNIASAATVEHLNGSWPYYQDSYLWFRVLRPCGNSGDIMISYPPNTSPSNY